jgi:hypothetical protein
MSEELARRSAHILGPSSAAYLALAELERRRALGEPCEIFDYQRRWIVVSTACAAAAIREAAKEPIGG